METGIRQKPDIGEKAVPSAMKRLAQRVLPHRKAEMAASFGLAMTVCFQSFAIGCSPINLSHRG